MNDKASDKAPAQHTVITWPMKLNYFYVEGTGPVQGKNKAVRRAQHAGVEVTHAWDSIAGQWFALAPVLQRDNVGNPPPDWFPPLSPGKNPKPVYSAPANGAGRSTDPGKRPGKQYRTVHTPATVTVTRRVMAGSIEEAKQRAMEQFEKMNERDFYKGLKFSSPGTPQVE